ncbi:Gfo/Idh/MocA family protein [Bryobacter aggregatus]|uniref:Gfo/Idh/MocA family protein n=1 Tax=Bryobacter aggregatus TaxID=360054 RepID=UPI0004E1C4DD|nr:Gfo/Idh/MocA family oxidoreductase [Bryobacter aggregatus]
MQRRAFVATALAATQVQGANERVRLALVGSGGRGRYVAGFAKENPHAQYVATADVYLPNAEAAAKQLGAAESVQDFRRLLDRKDIDAIIVATPDHWHATIAILAARAGKDVYVEKPLSYSVVEGRRIVDAMASTKRLIFGGTQHRSAPHFAQAADLIQSGYIGPVKYVRIWNYVNWHPNAISQVPDSAAPPGLNWDMYLGPAPKAAFNQRRFLSTFRHYRDYAGGTITDYGTHRFDTLHQIMGLKGSDAAPKAVSASGGRLLLQGAGDNPDLLQVTYEYENFVMSYEGVNFNGHGGGLRTPGFKYYNQVGTQDLPNGMIFYGTKGTMLAERVGFEIYPEPTGRDGNLPQCQPMTVVARDATREHAMRFVDCVRGAQTANATAESAHMATNIGHLGNIALRTGKKLQWNAKTEKFDAPEGNALLSRTPRPEWTLI